MSAAHHTGVLLVNLGTPAAPDTASVRRYLREFLRDPFVLDISAPARALLVDLWIAPFRAPRSAAAYRQIWRPEGSPLLVHGRALRARVEERWNAGPVALAMRYGEPSMTAALTGLRGAGCERLVVLPLYPQYAESSTRTAIKAVQRAAAAICPAVQLRFVDPFYDHPAFVRALAAVGRPVLDEFAPEHVLMSFHGLPERHLRRVDHTGAWCLARADCCDAVGPENHRCYRAHCSATARALATALALPADRWSMSFQSRLGRTKWIEPYTDHVVPALAARGVRRLAVCCPAFVADCLETLEEIGIRAAASFRAAGGEELRLVPGLNATAPWVEAVLELLAAAA